MLTGYQRKLSLIFCPRFHLTFYPYSFSLLSLSLSRVFILYSVCVSSLLPLHCLQFSSNLDKTFILLEFFVLYQVYEVFADGVGSVRRYVLNTKWINVCRWDWYDIMYQNFIITFVLHSRCIK